MKLKTALFCMILFIGYFITYAGENSDLVYTGVGKTIGIEGVEKYFPLLGYTVLYPEIIDKDYKLRDISLGVGLSKGVTQDESSKLEEQMVNAIEDKAVFKKLKSYGPYRTMGAIYSKEDESSIVVVATIPTEMYKIVEVPGDSEKFLNEKNIKFKKYMIKDIKCYWIDYHESFNEAPSFNWDMNGVTYMVFSIKGEFLLMENAAAIAEKIIEFNTGGVKK